MPEERWDCEGEKVAVGFDVLLDDFEGAYVDGGFRDMTDGYPSCSYGTRGRDTGRERDGVTIRKKNLGLLKR